MLPNRYRLPRDDPICGGCVMSEDRRDTSLRDHLKSVLSPEYPACAAPLGGTGVAILLYVDRPISPETLVLAARCTDRLRALELGLASMEVRSPSNSPEITLAMIKAGAAVLEDFTEAGEGLTNTATYVVEQVYRAMEKRKLEKLVDQNGHC